MKFEIGWFRSGKSAFFLSLGEGERKGGRCYFLIGDIASGICKLDDLGVEGALYMHSTSAFDIAKFAYRAHICTNDGTPEFDER